MEDWQRKFIEQMMPHALTASQATGIDPRIIIGQAAVESNYGKSAPGNNYFGIKAVGNQPGQSLTTKEVGPQGEYTTQQPFRTYGGMEDSVKGYADFINSNPRYKDFKSGGDIDAQLKALGQSGYATAPNYSNVVGGVARNINIDPNAAPAAPAAAPNPSTGLFGMFGGSSAPAKTPTEMVQNINENGLFGKIASAVGSPIQTQMATDPAAQALQAYQAQSGYGQATGGLASLGSLLMQAGQGQQQRPVQFQPPRRPQQFSGFSFLG